ncbi:PucR family transcriptional regulator [Streptomyces viridochromogenes]|uniref:PucR family transcriptional regulator n=1 Tax=Streptomyces viridochromogenes TaxID=1938 RepID=A0A0J7Z8B7_STRVR|nr:helix-turn-helix domain-containing protein [Streptomyces viridochromogenes]KMS71732.1 PucR family transcriptional regulator [Streptomyces viridochromogenes]KOG17761.1 PucR family transcriptional regulator [Streptomyces viridochromogenes]KOG18864.1 PucR family transcriptional regulator [Streptomyces viridochromogenes]
MAGREDGIRQAGVGGADASVWAQELLDHLRPNGRDVGRVVAWLANAVQGTASLQDDTGTLLAGARPHLDDNLVAAVAAGRIASAAWEGQGRHLRLVRVAYPNPASAGVLAVSREAPFDRRVSDMVTHTVQVIELLLKAGETIAAGRRLARATSDLRLAILQLLMVEDTVSARRVAAGLWPGLLDTDTACVHVVECPADERDRLVVECLDVTGERALVVLCPAVDEHVIVVTPDDGAARDLRSLIGPRPRTFIGGSARQSLARTAAAYGQAVSALAVAHFRPDKAAVYAERTHPERLIDPAPLRGWAARLLRPLDTLAHHTRAELLATTRLGLEFTAVSAAKVLGVSRNTVRARMERVETLLRTDFSDLTARAVVHLALNTQVSLADAPADTGTPEAGHASLRDLLSGPAMLTWAHDVLAGLDKDTRDLRRSLRTWIAEGGNAERAAQTLGVHAQTVREHVRSAEPVLERQLLAGGSDLYEIVLAHLAVGDLDEPALPTTKSGLPDSLVHR